MRLGRNSYIYTTRNVSCVIRINPTDSFVFDSPYCAVFDRLKTAVYSMDEKDLCRCKSNRNYAICNKKAVCFT